MSGSQRAITLTLSVRDADKVRQELEKIGPAGESAINRLDVAAKRAASGASGGMQALNTATAETSNKMGSMRQVIGSAGFQLQDFVIQVQGGTSALTALSQQGSQFLGAFGPAGAAAGAVLTVGLLIAQFLRTGETAEQEIKRTEANFQGMQRASEDVARVLREINDLFLTAGERAAAATNRQTQALEADARRLLDISIQRNEGNVIELAQARRELADREAAIARRDADIQARTGSRTNEFQSQDQANLYPSRLRIAGLEADLQRSGARIGELTEALNRVRNAPVAMPEAHNMPPDPTRANQQAAQRGAAEAARALRVEQQGINELLREQEGIVRANETPYERYQRQLADLAALQERLTEAQRQGAEVNGMAVQALSTEQMARATGRFASELERAEKAGKDADDIGRSLGLTFTSAFEDAIIKGKEFREILAAIAQDIARIILRKSITEPAGNAITGLLKGVNFGGFFGNIFGGGGMSSAQMTSAYNSFFVASANGNIFSGGNVVPFARGGIVQRPQIFPMANGGLGLMGEAGPEAIMPLRRDGTGRLGVASAGGGGTVINQSINVDARGADAGVDQKIRAGISIAVQQANAELLAQINRGGSVAKTVGRRA